MPLPVCERLSRLHDQVTCCRQITCKISGTGAQNSCPHCGARLQAVTIHLVHSWLHTFEVLALHVTAANKAAKRF